MKRIAIGVAIVVAMVLVGYFFVLPPILRDSCLDNGGSWRSNLTACQFSARIEVKPPLPSYNNTAICSSLVVGITERELILKLGQPIKKDGRMLFFATGAAEPSPAVELDSDGMATHFYCKGFVQQNAPEDALKQRASER